MTGVRIHQPHDDPHYVVLQLEMFGTRVIPVGPGGRWPTWSPAPVTM